MYTHKTLITSLFNNGFESESIKKITDILNNDVTNNILDELISEKAHKLAVSNFNKTLIAQSKELEALKLKVAEYERTHAILTHDRSANPWRNLKNELETYDELPDVLGDSGNLIDRITGKQVSVGGEDTMFPKKPYTGGMLFDDVSDVDEIMQSDAYQKIKAEVDEQRDIASKRNTDLKAKNELDILLAGNHISIKDFMKSHPSQDDKSNPKVQPECSPVENPKPIKGKNGVKATVKTPVKKAVKKPSTKVNKKVVKK